ncbi:hypothetical protein FQN57_001748 [Myotisia sp. PD_48]|nr:hypothetical protein FQN57_001748 [Myotisia sp. PD_48]
MGSTREKVYRLSSFFRRGKESSKPVAKGDQHDEPQTRRATISDSAGTDTSLQKIPINSHDEGLVQSLPAKANMPSIGSRSHSEPAILYHSESRLGNSSSQSQDNDSRDLSLDNPIKLWDEAYDQLKRLEPAIVEAYEKILSQDYEGNQAQENVIEQGDWSRRRSQMDRILRNVLQDIPKPTGGERVMADAINVILSLKEVIGHSLHPVPVAAVAWTGVCIGLQLASDSIAEEQARNAGVVDIALKMKWYSSLSQIILDDKHKKLSNLRSSLPDGILDFYVNILACLLKSICATYKGRTQIFRDMLKLDGWEAMFRTTNEKEVYFRNAIRDYSNERKISYLEILVDLYRSSAEDEVLRKLFLVNMKTEIQSLQHRKDDLIPESSNWILSNDMFLKFASWEEENRYRRLWIKGKAGMGKTMLLIGVVNKLEDQLQKQQETRFDAPYLSYFFCQGTNGRLNTATAVVRGLIWMFLRQDRSLVQYAMRLAGQSLDNEDLNTFLEIKSILLAMLKNPIMKRVYIIIDALDECIDVSRSGGVPGRAHLLDLISQISRDFPNVKCLTSSRDELDIEIKLSKPREESWVSLQLELDRKFLSGPIKAYINKKILNLEAKFLAEWEFEGEIEEEDREMIHTKLQDVAKEMDRKADGTFLWVALVFLRIEDERTDLRELQRLVNETPEKLEEIYEKMKLQIQTNKDGNSGFCMKALSIATTANRPLRLAEIRLLADFPRDVSPMKILKLCRFFRIAEDDDKQMTVYMIHQSAKQWFEQQLKEGLLDTIEGNDHLASSHASLAKQCLQVLSSSLKMNIWNLPDPGVEISQIQSASQGYAPASDQTSETRIVYPPIARDDNLLPVTYAALNWFDHVLKGDSQDDGQNLVAVLNFMKHHFLHWLEALSLLRQVGDGAIIIVRLNRFIEVSPFPFVMTIICSRMLIHLKSISNSGKSSRTLTDLISLVRDANRFTLYYQGIIETAPLQVYAAGMEFSPMQSQIKALFKQDRPKWITTSPIIEGHWDLCLQTLEAHKGYVASIAFSHDGKRLASGSYDKTVCIWVAETGTLQHTLHGHQDWISSVVFSHDGKQLASGSHDTSVRIWDAETGTLRQILMDHKDLVSSVAFSPGGSWLASSSHDGTICLYELKTGTLHQITEPSDIWIVSIAFSNDGSKLVAGLYDGKIGIWDVESGTQHSLYEGHKNSISSVAFSRDDQQVASGSYDTTICVWDVKTTELCQTIKGHKSPVLSLAFSPEGYRLAFGSGDELVRVWNNKTNEVELTFKGHRKSTLSVAFSPDGKRLASSSQDKTIRVWDMETEATQQNSHCHGRPVSALAFSQNGKLLSSASFDSTIRIWDADTGDFHKILKGHRSAVYSLAFSPNGKFLASASYDKTIHIWNAEKWTVQHILKGHRNSVHAIAFSPDGQQIASGSHDKTIRVWITETGTLQHTLMDHSNSVTSVAFSDDGQLLISGSQDQTVRIWGVKTGVLQQTLKCQSPISCVAISHDMQRFAAGAHDETVTIWDAVTGGLDKSFGIGSTPSKLAFTEDGNGLVTERGYIPCQPSSHSSQPLAPSIYSVLADKSWITWNGDKKLWIPWEYRPVCLMVRNNKIAIGCASGRVFLLGFSSSTFPTTQRVIKGGTSSK